MAIMIFGTNRARAMGAVFAIFLAASVGAYNTNKWNFDTHPGPVVCINDKDCGLHGSCVSISKEEMGKNIASVITHMLTKLMEINTFHVHI